MISGMYGSEFKNDSVAKSSLNEDEQEERKYIQKLNNWRKGIYFLLVKLCFSPLTFCFS